jgi:hypothetical protein
MKPRATTVIAYGSLMSGLGLKSFGTLPVLDATRVRLTGCRRGFGKLSQYGDRFAMVLEPTEAGVPIACAPITAATPTEHDGGVDALALTMSIPELARVAQREGYRANVVLALAHAAETQGRGLGAHLWAMVAAAGFDVGRYRRALADSAAYTSAHYVPHPVATGGEPAITFLAPGSEGSGRDDVVPIRVQSAVTRLFTFREVWRLKPTASQLDYAAMCVCAELHNLSLADVLHDLPAYPPLAERLRARVREEADAETAAFCELLGVAAERYAERFSATPRRAAFVG